jgi:hypothetical protein
MQIRADYCEWEAEKEKKQNAVRYQKKWGHVKKEVMVNEEKECRD